MADSKEENVQQMLSLDGVTSITEARNRSKQRKKSERSYDPRQEVIKTVEGFMNKKYGQQLAATQNKLGEALDAIQALYDKNEHLAKKNEKLATTVERIIPLFEKKAIDDENPCIRVGPIQEGKEFDVATVGMACPGELYYSMSTKQIGDLVGNDRMTASKMGSILRKLKIWGDPEFHYQRSYGKSIQQWYQPDVIDEVYRRVANPEKYELDPVEVAKVINSLKPREFVKA